MGTQEWLSFYRGNRLNQKIRFAVYEHKLVDSSGNIIRRNFIVLKDEDGDVVLWTNFHRYAKNGRKVVVRSIYSDDEKRLRSIVKLLNYVFFDRYHISRLTEIRPEMVKGFLNDYGLCRLPDCVRRKPAMCEDRILPLDLECDSKCAMDRSSMSLLIFARRKIFDPILSMSAELRNRESKRCIRPASSGTCSQPAYFILKLPTPKRCVEP